MSRHPLVKWSQRSDILFFTVELPDAKDVKLNLDPEGKFFFSATSGTDNVPYEIDLDLYDKVNVSESKANITSRNVVYLIKKAESKWWSRILKQEGKPPAFLKVDWNKWVDEDEDEDENPGLDMEPGDIDFSQLNLGGAGDYDAEGADDEDDESDTDEEDENQEEGAAVDVRAEAATANGRPEATPAGSESVAKA